MTPTAYVAGPMTGLPGFNYEAFDGARDVLVSEGWEVISPADLDRVNLGIDFSTMTGNEDLSEFVTDFARQDVDALLKVHAVFVLDGWEASTGARNEMAIATMIGVPIYSFSSRDVVEVDARFSNTVEQRSEPASQIGNDCSVVLERTDVAQSGFEGAVSEFLRADIDAPREHVTDGGECWCGPEVVSYADGGIVSADSAPLIGEVRVVDPETGGEKGTKLARFDLLPPGALWQIAEHFGRGADKYEARNWERGYKWSLSYGALLRHLMAWWNGEDDDPELGSPHLAAVGFHVLALLHFAEHHSDGDDRP